MSKPRIGCVCVCVCVCAPAPGESGLAWRGSKGLRFPLKSRGDGGSQADLAQSWIWPPSAVESQAGNERKRTLCRLPASSPCTPPLQPPPPLGTANAAGHPCPGVAWPLRPQGPCPDRSPTPAPPKESSPLTGDMLVCLCLRWPVLRSWPHRSQHRSQAVAGFGQGHSWYST